MSWGRGCAPLGVLPHNFANVSFVITTYFIFIFTSSYAQIQTIKKWFVGKIWILFCVFCDFRDFPNCYFRQSWLASSWALTGLPPTSSPSCSSSSTPATGLSTWSSCQTSSSTGYLSEFPARIRPICLLVYHFTIYASIWTLFTKRKNCKLIHWWWWGRWFS